MHDQRLLLDFYTLTVLNPYRALSLAICYRLLITMSTARPQEAKGSGDRQKAAAVEAEIAVANHKSQKELFSLSSSTLRPILTLYPFRTGARADYEDQDISSAPVQQGYRLPTTRARGKQLERSGFPMEVFKHGFPLYNLSEKHRDVFKMIDEQDLHAVTILLGEQGRLLFGRRQDGYAMLESQRPSPENNPLVKDDLCILSRLVSIGYSLRPLPYRRLRV